MQGKALGPYRLLDELGSGGMGTVHAAEVTGDAPGLERGSKVALKIVHPHLLATPGFFKRFLREAEIGRRVEHPNVVRTLDVDALKVEGEQLNFLVMEYVEGQTLRELLTELGRVPEELCRHIGREVAAALAAIHAAGVVHRDLKPENVLITTDHVIKVMDLGVAQLADEAIRLSQTGAFIGSVLYAAPEQFRGEEPDGRADFYALGLVLYELATGRHPTRTDDFASIMRERLEETPRPAGQVNPQLSAYFEEVLQCLLAPDREARLDHLPEEDSDWWRERARTIRAETKRPLRRIRIPRETALYGRDDDLARLGQLFAAARDGNGRVVIVEGEAGIGKTRLVDEFVAALDDEVHFLFGCYPPGGAATASGAFSTAYREHFGSEGLERSLQEYLPRTPILVPAFAALLRGEPPPENKQPLTKDSLQTVFVDATRSLARERPTVVLIDDLHFAPSEGRALFAALAAALADERFLLIGTTRPGLDESWLAGMERQPHATRHALQRLGPKDLTHLLVDAFRSKQLAEDLGFKIAAKSDGNPFFVFEMIRGLREGQFITQTEDGRWVQTQVIGQIKVPSSIHDLVQARIADLEEEDRDLLDVAACVGFEFDPLLVGEIVGVKRIPLLKRLAQIERRHRLIRSAGTAYVFDHHQVQEALYASLPELLAREYHAGIAEALEESEASGELALCLCEHWLRAARGEEALGHLDPALQELEEQYLYDRATELLDRALAVPGLLAGEARCDRILRKAQFLRRQAMPAAALAALEEAAAIAEEAGDRKRQARALAERAWHLRSLVRLAEAEEAAARAIEFEENPDILTTAGIIALESRRYAVARERYRRAVDKLAETASSGEVEASRAIANLAILSYWQGDLGEALRMQTGSYRANTAAGAVLRAAVALINQADLYARLGDAERAETCARKYQETSAAIGNRPAEAYAHETLGEIALNTGNAERALELYDRAIRFRETSGYRIDLNRNYVGRARALRALGRDEEATTTLQQALEAARERGDVEAEVVTLAMLAQDKDPRKIAAADDLLERTSDSLAVTWSMEAHYLLWCATGRPQPLEEAHAILEKMRTSAPDEYRDSMIENVPLHRDIMAAWAEHGGES